MRPTDQLTTVNIQQEAREILRVVDFTVQAFSHDPQTRETHDSAIIRTTNGRFDTHIVPHLLELLTLCIQQADSGNYKVELSVTSSAQTPQEGVNLSRTVTAPQNVSADAHDPLNVAMSSLDRNLKQHIFPYMLALHMHHYRLQTQNVSTGIAEINFHATITPAGDHAVDYALQHRVRMFPAAPQQHPENVAAAGAESDVSPEVQETQPRLDAQ